jgi:hypothetical protein
MMFDRLRQKSAEEAEFLSDETVEPAPPPAQKPKVARPRRRRSDGALTPVQRFMLALFLLLNVTVLGGFALLVFEKISLDRLLPF